MNSLWIVVALVFLAATLICYALYWVFVFNRREQRIINRRLELAKHVANAAVVLQTLRQERGFVDLGDPRLRRLRDWLTQTGTRVRPQILGLGFAVLCLVLIVLVGAALGAGLVSFALALSAAAAVMIGFLNLQRRRRIFSFGEQLPDALDIITRGVRVGLPFSSAIVLMAREMPDPVGSEFGMLADEISFGLDLRSALENLYRRVGHDDLLFVAIAVSIQSQTGGNLGEILSRLAKLMRSRAKMRLKIKSLSAEGRFSAAALTVFPLLLFAVINLLSPSYYGAIRGNPLVEPALFFGLFLLIAGNIIMYRMVHFKY